MSRTTPVLLAAARAISLLTQSLCACCVQVMDQLRYSGAEVLGIASTKVVTELTDDKGTGDKGAGVSAAAAGGAARGGDQRQGEAGGGGSEDGRGAGGIGGEGEGPGAEGEELRAAVEPLLPT